MLKVSDVNREKCQWFLWSSDPSKIIAVRSSALHEECRWKKYDENCEKFELGSFSYRGPNSSGTMTISVRNHPTISGFFIIQSQN